MSEEVVSVRAVSYGYGTGFRPALDGVSFAVERGHLTSIVGQTGSGKSTLARLLCGLSLPDSGEIRVLGQPTSDKRCRQALRGRVGYVMQMPERQLFCDTVAEDIAYGPRNLGLGEDETRRRVSETIGFVGLDESLLDLSPFELSGGQRRMVAIAGTLAMGPEVLVMDEPTAGLDPRGRRRLEAVVGNLRDAGTTVVLVTHSMDMAATGDRVVVLSQGRLLMEGAPREVFAHETELVAVGLGIPAALSFAHGLERRRGLPRGRLGEPLDLDALADAVAREVPGWR